MKESLKYGLIGGIVCVGIAVILFLLMFLLAYTSEGAGGLIPGVLGVFIAFPVAFLLQSLGVEGGELSILIGVLFYFLIGFFVGLLVRSPRKKIYLAVAGFASIVLYILDDSIFLVFLMIFFISFITYVILNRLKLKNEKNKSNKKGGTK